MFLRKEMGFFPLDSVSKIVFEDIGATFLRISVGNDKGCFKQKYLLERKYF